MPPEDNCMFKGITTSSTVPDKAIINIDMQLKDIDRELSKFDSQDSSHSMPIERVSPLDRVPDQVHKTHTSRVNEARASHEPAKVSLNPNPLRVLPTWSR